MEICKAIRHEGSAKGKRCENHTSNNDGYCDRHKRNKKFDEGVNNGIMWCRMFWRGCDNQINGLQKTCDGCLSKQKCIAKQMCKKDGCKFKEKEGGYCGKHLRQSIIDEANIKGIELCDPARGCFTPLTNDRRKCEECRTKQYHQERKRIEKRRQQKEHIEHEDTTKSSCLSC
jgi:hypothetical protein